MLIRLRTFFNSLLGHFTVAAVLSFALLVLGVFYDENRTLKTAVLENVKASVSQSSQLLNMTVSTYLSKQNLDMVKIFFTEMLDEHAENGLTYVVIGDSEGRILLSTLETMKTLPSPLEGKEIDFAAVRRGEIHIRNPLLLPGRTEGFLQYGLSTKSLIDATVKEQRNALLRSAMIMLMTFAVTFLLGLRISRRLKEMTRASQAIVAGEYGQSIVVKGKDELATLAGHFNLMTHEVSKKISEITELNQQLEQRVAKRTAELALANQMQEKHLQHLKDTQDQLINSEKLAALGSLVAGVAHELNTPIGNALTIATTMSDNVTEARQQFEQGALKKNVLDRHFKMLAEADTLLVTNIQRAIELINSFKTIAVDQTSELRRCFDLKTLMTELELTLNLQLRKRPYSLQTDISAGIVMDSFPGPLTQIILNLFNNAILHGFEGRDAGHLRLWAELDDAAHHVHIHFSDDGCGIPKENLQKIFDPFFTTKLGHGGSGLGLNICYNLVQGVLGGSMDVSSEVGKGTEFELVLPLLAPYRGKDEDKIDEVPSPLENR